MAVTAALIAGGAGLASAGIGAATSLAGGRGTQQRLDNTQALLAQAQNDAIQARINAAYTTRLGQAGYTDSQGNSYSYDPATNQWVSTLGKLPAQVQTAADQAAISRNTTDLRQAQGANARADINASRAQPLIDAARRRLENFQPMTGSGLGDLLGQTAANANTQAYRPIIQATLSQQTRSGQDPGAAMAQLGQRSSEGLRQGMIDARVRGLTGAEDINNARRQGLSSDLSSAITAGTPQFQYPGIVPSTNTKDMLTALQNRATGAAYSSALGNASINQADAEAQKAGTAVTGAIPTDSASLVGLSSAGKDLTTFLGSSQFKDLYTALTNPDKLNNTAPLPKTTTDSFGNPNDTSGSR